MIHLILTYLILNKTKNTYSFIAIKYRSTKEMNVYDNYKNVI